MTVVRTDNTMKPSFNKLSRLATSADSKRWHFQAFKAFLGLGRPREDLREEGSEYFDIVRSSEGKCSSHTMCRFLQVDEGLSHFDCICAACSILDDMASCLWHCERGDHSVEYLCGKVCSHSKAALCLIRNGYYDEALALCRIIGETANLLCLFCADRQELKKWRSLEEERQYAKFKPNSVRDRLKNMGITNPPINRERYKELSTRSVHASPRARPNEHNDSNTPVLGSILQEKGLKLGLSELARLLCLATFFGSKLLRLPDTPKQIISMHIISIAKTMNICLDSFEFGSTNSS